jgi:capsular polysaccharide export protein
MDPAGVNYANSLNGLPPEFYRSISMDSDKLDAMLNTILQQRPLRGRKRASVDDSDDDKALPERYVLYAMQVHDDSQVLLFSPHFPSMESVIPYVVDRLAAYNQRYNDTLELVVKEHPSDFGRVNYDEMRASLPGVRFMQSTPVSELIDRASAVLTLNSTVGIEALLSFRPVITLGEAFYNVPGMVQHLKDGDDLVDLLAATIDTLVDRDLITRFLYFLRYEYLVPVSKNTRSHENVGPAADRVVEVLNGQWPYWPLAGTVDR